MGLKKWQARSFYANEVFFTWHSYDKNSKQDEVKGNMRIAEMDDIAPATIKGQEHAFTVSGMFLPHTYSFATKTRTERDEWVHALRQLRAAEKLLHLGRQPGLEQLGVEPEQKAKPKPEPKPEPATEPEPEPAAEEGVPPET